MGVGPAAAEDRGEVPGDTLLTRQEVIDALLAHAVETRKDLIGIDETGKGGVVTPNGKWTSKYWRVEIATLVFACVEGDPKWVELPKG